MNIYITGDTHGSFVRIKQFCDKMQTTRDDLLIILGDAGFNFTMNFADKIKKEYVKDINITLFCIHGNHEERPYNIETYKTKEWNSGVVYYEDAYPNILFAKDGEIYTLNDKTYFVFGGGFSVDKEWRLYRCPETWFPSELPTQEMKDYAITQLDSVNWSVDFVLTHTCPKRYEPVEWFLTGVKQDNVDKTLEEYLDLIESRLKYTKWFCGHFHGEKEIDNLKFMFTDFDVIV